MAAWHLRDKWKDWGVIEKAVAPLGAASLARYAGNYQLGPMTIAVTQTGDRMLVAAPPLGPQPREIFPSSETTFFNLLDGMEFTFKADEAGKLDLIIHAGQVHKTTRVP